MNISYLQIQIIYVEGEINLSDDMGLGENHFSWKFRHIVQVWEGNY